MSRTWWIIVAVAAAVAVGIAVLVGVLGTRNSDTPTKTESVSSLCSSLKGLQTSVKTLTNIDTSTATKSELQNDVNGVEESWNQVKSDAQAVQDAPTGSLDSAWDDFTSAVKDIPNADSVSDAASSVTEAAQQLGSAAQSTASTIDCSS
jgi:uncharacterized protein YoxC